jgi:hypothetical protein
VTYRELSEEIAIEIEMLQEIVRELQALRTELGDKEPTVREKAAAGAFLAQFYGAVENILKRISRFHAVPLPTGDTWHMEIYKRFCSPGLFGLPVLFDDQLSVSMSAYRKFRHVVYHGYVFQLDWNRMREGIDNIDAVSKRFTANLERYLESIRNTFKR